MSVTGRLVHHVTLGCSLPEARSGAKVATATAAASYHHHTCRLPVPAVAVTMPFS